MVGGIVACVRPFHEAQLWVQATYVLNHAEILCRGHWHVTSPSPTLYDTSSACASAVPVARGGAYYRGSLV